MGRLADRVERRDDASGGMSTLISGVADALVAGLELDQFLSCEAMCLSCFEDADAISSSIAFASTEASLERAVHPSGQFGLAMKPLGRKYSRIAKLFRGANWLAAFEAAVVERPCRDARGSSFRRRSRQRLQRRPARVEELPSCIGGRLLIADVVELLS